jgi:hypothetical protein
MADGYTRKHESGSIKRKKQKQKDANVKKISGSLLKYVVENAHANVASQSQASSQTNESKRDGGNPDVCYGVTGVEIETVQTPSKSNLPFSVSLCEQCGILYDEHELSEHELLCDAKANTNSETEMQVIERSLSLADTFDGDYAETSTHPDPKLEDETALKPFDMTEPSATASAISEIRQGSSMHEKPNADPVHWEVDADLKEYFAYNVPPQNLDDDFEKSMRWFGRKNPVKRCIQRSYFYREMTNGEQRNRDWLIYSPSTGKVYCYVCMKLDCSESMIKIELKMHALQMRC